MREIVTADWTGTVGAIGSVVAALTGVVGGGAGIYALREQRRGETRRRVAPPVELVEPLRVIAQFTDAQSRRTPAGAEPWRESRMTAAVAKVEGSIPLVAGNPLLQTHLIGVTTYFGLAKSNAEPGHNEDAARAAHRVTVFRQYCDRVRDDALRAAETIREAQ